MGALVVASPCKNAGKTSVIVGLARNVESPIGYVKPFGDRLFYRKKQLWDYDSSTMKNIFGLEERPEDMSIGFEHSKLRYMYDYNGVRDKLKEMVSDDRTYFIEGARDFLYGASVHLDSLSVARHTGASLVLVASGNEDSMLDDLAFFKKHISHSDLDFRGVILNNIHDVAEFKDTYLHELEELGLDVLGIIPHMKKLTELTVEYLSHALFAKVVTGDEGLDKHVRNIFVGAMSADSALHNPLFAKKDKLIITSGDRSDMILAALDESTACVVLTNNILPPANIISMASDKNIPLLVVPTDTYQTAKRIDGTEPLISADDTEKICLVEEAVRENVDIHRLMNGL